MKRFNQQRINGIISSPFDSDHLIYLFRNVAKLRCITVEKELYFESSTEEIALVKNYKVPSSSTKAVSRFLANLSSQLEDEEFYKTFSLESSEYFTKRSKLSKMFIFFQKLKHETRTIQVLKCCGKECSEVAIQEMEDNFASLSLKHSLQSVIVTIFRDPNHIVRVAHCFESRSIGFHLFWQLVIRIDTSNNVNTKFQVVATNIIWRKQEIFGAQEDEMIRNIISQYIPPNITPTIIIDNNDVINNLPRKDLLTTSQESVFMSSIDDEYENLQSSSSLHDNTTGSLASYRFSEQINFKVDGENEDEDAFFTTSGDAKTNSENMIDDLDFNDLPLSSARSSSTITAPDNNIFDDHNDVDDDGHTSGKQHEIVSSTPQHISLSESGKIKGWNSVTKTSSKEAPLIGTARPHHVSSLPKKYQSSKLVLGETIQPLHVFNDILLKYGEFTSKEQTKQTKGKWNGILFGGSKERTAAASISGQILLTNFQIIFVPEITGEEISQSDQNNAENINLTHRKLRDYHNLSNNNNNNGNNNDDDYSYMLHRANKTLTSAFEIEASNNQQRLIAISHSYLSLLSSTEDHIYIPYPIISNIEKVHQRFGDPKVIEIQCKDFRSVYFSFKNSTSSVSDFIDVLRIYFPMKLDELFAFKFYENLYKLSEKHQLPMTMIEGWNVYNPFDELRRIIDQDRNWQIIHQPTYQFSEMYCKYFAVPKAITENDLLKIKEYRSKGFPTLSWRNPEKGNSLTRSSQPRVGRSSRCPEDEKLLFEINICNQREGRILPSSSSSSSSSDVNYVLPLCLMDARPKSDAMASIAATSSFDSINRQHIKLFFLNIPNLHATRDAANKLHECCLPNYHKTQNTDWLSNLEDTHWIEYCNLLLKSAMKIASFIQSGVNVLIHCNDGLDRTSQLTSLAMLLLDPYYRTLKGFIVLIEKEWLGFGHEFQDRCGQLFERDQEACSTKTSPIFLQFIDCVWQITQQQPNEFQFNSHLLIFLLDHIYTCFYGTFLTNCDRDRSNLVKNRTVSIWSHVLENQSLYLNPSYHPPSIQYRPQKRTSFPIGGNNININIQNDIRLDGGGSGGSEVKVDDVLEEIHRNCYLRMLEISTSMKSMLFWSDFYLRYDKTVSNSFASIFENVILTSIHSSRRQSLAIHSAFNFPEPINFNSEMIHHHHECDDGDAIEELEVVIPLTDSISPSFAQNDQSNEDDGNNNGCDDDKEEDINLSVNESVKIGTLNYESLVNELEEEKANLSKLMNEHSSLIQHITKLREEVDDFASSSFEIKYEKSLYSRLLHELNFLQSRST